MKKSNAIEREKRKGRGIRQMGNETESNEKLTGEFQNQKTPQT